MEHIRRRTRTPRNGGVARIHRVDDRGRHATSRRLKRMVYRLTAGIFLHSPVEPSFGFTLESAESASADGLEFKRGV
jgi:hypothetical protein